MVCLKICEWGKQVFTTLVCFVLLSLSLVPPLYAHLQPMTHPVSLLSLDPPRRVCVCVCAVALVEMMGLFIIGQVCASKAPTLSFSPSIYPFKWCIWIMSDKRKSSLLHSEALYFLFVFLLLDFLPSQSYWQCTKAQPVAFYYWFCFFFIL